jgi:hypothetical protein
LIHVTDSSKVVGKAKGLDWRSLRKPKELQAILNVSIPELEKIARETLHEQGYYLQEIADFLEIQLDELIELSLRPNVQRGKEMARRSD